MRGAFGKYKDRLVARGFLQKLGVDFFSTFSPMATLTSLRILLAIAVHHNLSIVHADIPQAFLKARSIRTVGYNFLPENKQKWYLVFLYHKWET